MEVDSFDGLYKQVNDIINKKDYFLGDLVMFSDENIPNDKYLVKCHSNEEIVYDSIVKAGRYKRGYRFKLKLSGSKLSSNEPIYFYGKKVDNIKSRFKYSWVLQESAEASKLLELLEAKYEYNTLGETTLLDE